MKKNSATRWQSTIDGKDYTFDLQRMTKEYMLKQKELTGKYLPVMGKYLLTVNDEEIPIKTHSNGMFVELDESFTFDGKEARLVQVGKEVDVVYNNFFLQSGKEYVGVPKWIWIFVFLCILMPIIRGGRFSLAVIAIGIGGSFIYMMISKKKTPPLIHDVITLVAIIFGGAVTFIFGFISSYLCVQISRRNSSSFLKILFCVMIVIITWFLTLFTLGIVSSYNIF